MIQLAKFIDHFVNFMGHMTIAIRETIDKFSTIFIISLLHGEVTTTKQVLKKIAAVIVNCDRIAEQCD